MDEIVIEDKKYISSKQAAKLTGYAKDYIGQLCREGRVPARLVGRSWYVLEAAIQDHRFGAASEEPVEEKKKEEPTVSKLESTWEFPRYESTAADVLPSINRLRDTEEKKDVREESEADVAGEEPLQDSWKKWFDRFDYVAKGSEAIAPVVEDIQAGEKESPIEEDEVNVPIHSIYHPAQQKPIAEDVQEYLKKSDEKAPVTPRAHVGGNKTTKTYRATIQFVSILIGGAAFILAILSSGLLDSKLTSHPQVRTLAGISVYKK